MKPAEEYHQVIEPLIEDGDYQAAIGALESLLSANPDFACGYYELGTIHYKYGDKNMVLKCYLKAVENDPENIDYLRKLADFYHVELEQIESALEVYKKIIEKGDANSETLFIAANLCVVLHDFEEAVGFYQKVLEIEPWHVEASEYLAKIKKHLSSLPNRESPEELYRKSQDAGAAGKTESAMSILKKLVTEYPDYAIAHNDLGVYYQKMGNSDKSLEHLSEAIELDPYNITFEKNIADFKFAVMGNVNDALKHYLNVLKRDPEDTEVLIAAGYVCRALNQPEEAELFFKRVLEIEPWNLEAVEGMESIGKM